MDTSLELGAEGILPHLGAFVNTSVGILELGAKEDLSAWGFVNTAVGTWLYRPNELQGDFVRSSRCCDKVRPCCDHAHTYIEREEDLTEAREYAVLYSIAFTSS